MQVFQIGLYRIKIIFQEKKFYIGLTGTNNTWTEYVGIVSKFRKKEETIIPRDFFK